MGDTANGSSNLKPILKQWFYCLLQQLLTIAATFTATNAANVDALYAAIPVEVLRC
jgi:hypothetical protein